MFGRLRHRARSALENRWFPAMSLQRQLGPLEGCFNEWSVISDQFNPGQAASPDLIRIAIDTISVAFESPRDFLLEHDGNPDSRTWPGEHYRLLPALCGATHARKVVEIGTSTGQSALAFLTAPVVERVDTFDLIAWDDVPGTVLEATDFGPRLGQHLGDLADADLFVEHQGLLTDADLIFVDGPKDGHFEQVFLPKLLALRPERQQLIVLDDTRLMTMVQLWRDLPAPKLDLTSFGHWSGTGLLLR
jgi:predicted O-methyltransferase YrrM